MNINCNDRERIFLDGSPEEWTALEAHATNCAECHEELRAWKAISVAATELREYNEDPVLWTRIESALREQQRRSFWDRFAIWRGVPVALQAALVGALALVLAISGVYLAIHRNGTNGSSDKLLKNSALAEVERTQGDYVKAIDKLAAEAKPQLDAPASPLIASYREKLMVLDSAIDELRDEAGKNPSNAHLRYQLLAMYQEKQETLQEVLETKR
jgi:hypothetical protein